MKVGIIGYKGFVGSAFYAAFSSDPKYEVAGIDKGNYDSLCNSRFDILINANGNSSKPFADNNPASDFEMNVTGTLRFMRDFPHTHYVHISTVEVYPDRSSQQTTVEDSSINPLTLSNYGLSKYLGELIVRKHSKSWLILRMAGMVGLNMQKGPAYDILNLGKLFVSPKCRYQYMDTADAASICKALVQSGKWNEIYNVVGKGNIELAEFARMAGVTLGGVGTAYCEFSVNASKLESVMPVPTTQQSVNRFISAWKRPEA